MKLSLHTLDATQTVEELKAALDGVPDGTRVMFLYDSDQGVATFDRDDVFLETVTFTRPIRDARPPVQWDWEPAGTEAVLVIRIVQP